ncbi:MAG: HAMP domain-containing histidine kinase [Chitinispirillaceae bacterium]|nr:HAMP domain-containing histidine kinase [Chitinispirillaceae bacterium]
MQRIFNLFQWIIFLAVTAACANTVLRYWTPGGMVLSLFNLAVPPVLFIFFRKNSVNRLGIFLLCSPVIFLLETIYIIYHKLNIPVILAVNLLAIVFTVNLSLFAMFGRYFTGHLKKHIDIYLYPLLALSISAYVLLYLKEPFNLTPYIFLLAALTFFYLVMVRQLRAHERMITEQQQTISNTRDMVRSIIHDLSNFISAAYGWSKLAIKSDDPEKRKKHYAKAEYSFTHTADHIKTITSILCDRQNMVTLSQIAPQTFCDELFSSLRDSFVGKTVHVRGGPAELQPGRFTFSSPSTFQGKRLFADIPKMSSAILNLMTNARKAGADSMSLSIEENKEPAGLRLFFRDNGSGIPAPKVNMLFKERLNSETGSGVGLLGVRIIISCHNASIFCTNPNSSGNGITEFTIKTLPYESS